MKILLTGGSGFIGRNIVESFLNDKYQIFAPPRAELDCSDDQSVERYFSKHSFDVVLHSACKPGHRNAPDQTGILMTNSRMIFNLLKYQSSWGKMINMGSGAIYDMANYKPKVKEEHFGTYIPKDEHGYNKYIFGLLFPHYENVIDFRIFSIFGKYEDYAIRFISNMICKSLFDLPLTMKQNRRFDFFFIDDLMPVIDYFVTHDARYPAYNITPDQSVELLETAKLVRSISGKDLPIVVAQDGMNSEYSGDNSRLKLEIGNVNFTPLEKSVGLLYEWYRENKSKLDINKLLVDK
ncbi:MAG TPA: NAD(P)-dependent oxidoreductase [Cyclobacteriaceae bacterium]|nr:NAD(P)-dependent oxidoreductase [Cyclobacteriaceae bacterium]